MAAAALATTAGCGKAGPVPLAVTPAPNPKPTAAAVCQRLVSDLPGNVDDLERRAVEPTSDRVAAWGEDPAVVLRCGVARPIELTQTSQLVGVNDVDWFPLERLGKRVFTTVGRVANVELTIPLEHEPAVGPLVDLAATMERNNPKIATG